MQGQRLKFQHKKASQNRYCGNNVSDRNVCHNVIETASPLAFIPSVMYGSSHFSMYNKALANAKGMQAAPRALATWGSPA